MRGGEGCSGYEAEKNRQQGFKGTRMLNPKLLLQFLQTVPDLWFRQFTRTPLQISDQGGDTMLHTDVTSAIVKLTRSPVNTYTVSIFGPLINL